MPGRGKGFLRLVEKLPAAPDTDDRCFACGRPLGRSPALVDTQDGRHVIVGRSCAALIKKAGDAGYEAPEGGTLYLL